MFVKLDLKTCEELGIDPLHGGYSIDAEMYHDHFCSVLIKYEDPIYGGQEIDLDFHTSAGNEACFQWLTSHPMEATDYIRVRRKENTFMAAVID